ncbi:MAG: cation:proton antiporter [Tannerella sp.]|nr:cation:proton antiporter [Tannerella sp.]
MSFYIIMIVVFGSLMYLVAQKGSSQHPFNQNVNAHTETQPFSEGFRLFSHLTLEHVQSSLGVILLQILIILAVCRIAGLLFKKIGQPSVIGEVTAGIILGPSVLGHFFPEVSSFIFPEESFSNIRNLSQFGLILFMYTVGMELDLGVVKKRFQDTILISHASTIVPFFLGMLLAYFIYDTYANEEVPFLSFALFIGISLSITAFPVLARILQERGLTKTHLGSLSLASAANGDITAWCLLAVVVAYVQVGNISNAIFNILFSLVYIGVMLGIRQLLRIIGDLYHNKEVVDKSLVALMFFILLASSYVTEILGLHALFGAFIAGMIMPENMKFRKIMNEKVEDISLALFLPLFFVYMGLKTEIGLINGWETWLLCGVFILVAIVGKFGGTLLAARLSNESWKNSLYMGAFMNTRGLMELVVLSIGLEMKILTPTIFVILVLMTLVTTFMTAPLLLLIKSCFRKFDSVESCSEKEPKVNIFKVLLSFGRASNGQVMLDLAYQMFSERDEDVKITALHLTVGRDVNPRQAEDFEKYSFEPISYEADKLNVSIEKKYEVCDDKAEQYICSVANEEGFNFLLVGAGVSMSDLSTDVSAHKTWGKLFRIFGKDKSGNYKLSPGSLIRDKTNEFIEKSNCTVGIFVNRGFLRAENILVVFNSAKDLVLLDYVSTLQKSTHGVVKLMDRVSPVSPDSETVANALSEYLRQSKDTSIPFEKNLTTDILKEAKLMLVSYNTWLILKDECKEVLQDIPSTFIIEHKEVVKTDREKIKKNNATTK